jgi:transcription factor IIIB 90 kDa subunit
MSVSCNECGSTTIWDDDVGSAVCTSCGSLTDPSQSVLTSTHWGHQNDATDSSLWEPSPTTLKSLRSGNNWDLAGQGKESRDKKNMVNLILTIANNLLIWLA